MLRNGVRGDVSDGSGFLVIGGGIAGLSVALALASRAQRVTVFDEPRAGAASRASAGMLAPGIGFPDWLTDRAFAARDHYSGFLAALQAGTGLDVPLNHHGLIELVASRAAADAAVARLVRRVSGASNPAPEVLGATDLEALEPGLGSHPWGVLHPGDGAVDVHRLMDALDAAVALHPAIDRRKSAVSGVQVGEDAASVTHVDGGTTRGGCVVLAGGAWVSQLTGLPQPIPVRPVRGQLMLLARAGVRHVIDGGGGYLVPRGGMVLVGATVEEVGYAAESTLGGAAELSGIATRVLPALATAAVVDRWAGLRPVTPDGFPIAGRDPRAPRLAYCCGLSRNGVLFGPWLAEQLARALVEERTEGLDGFGIDRFVQR